ncbi:MAG: hypothetical protein MK008_13950 [Bdellovibrionales bacterium]|nr:hypothetical protein [Bdellovibrionales bacterium]
MKYLILMIVLLTPYISFSSNGFCEKDYGYFTVDKDGNVTEKKGINSKIFKKTINGNKITYTPKEVWKILGQVEPEVVLTTNKDQRIEKVSYKNHSWERRIGLYKTEKFEYKNGRCYLKKIEGTLDKKLLVDVDMCHELNEYLKNINNTSLCNCVDEFEENLTKIIRKYGGETTESFKKISQKYNYDIVKQAYISSINYSKTCEDIPQMSAALEDKSFWKSSQKRNVINTHKGTR